MISQLIDEPYWNELEDHLKKHFTLTELSEELVNRIHPHPDNEITALYVLIRDFNSFYLHSHWIARGILLKYTASNNDPGEKILINYSRLNEIDFNHVRKQLVYFIKAKNPRHVGDLSEVSNLEVLHQLLKSTQ